MTARKKLAVDNILFLDSIFLDSLSIVGVGFL